MIRSFVSLGLGAILVCLLGGSASAENAAVAREHYERGTKFYDIGRYDDAIHEFEAAYEAKSDPAFIYNLAQSHRLAGHNVEALRLYRNYLRYVPRAPNRADIENRIGELEKLTADHPAASPAAPPASPEPPAVVAPAPGPVVTPLSGSPPQSPAPAGSLPAPGPAPGPEAIPGEAVPVPGAATATWPIPAPGQAAQSAPPPARSPRRTAGVVIASVGGVLLVGGAISGLIARAESKKVEDAAQQHLQFDPSVQRVGKGAELFQWIAYGVGAAGLALGLILYETAPSPSGEAGTSRQVAVTPLAGPGLGGALVRVAF